MSAPAPTDTRPDGQHNIRPERWAQALPVDQLTPHPRNPNDGDEEAIAESLEVNGQYRAIIAWARTDGPHVILAGNTTYAAALSLGWQQIATDLVYADTEQEALRILLVDNRAARLARMNTAEELALLQELDDLAGTAYTQDNIEDLQAQLDAVAVLPLGVTDAHYAETPEDEDARQASRAGGTFEGRGVREMLLLFAGDDYDQVNRWLDTLRGRWGSGLTNAQVFAKAAETAVQATE